ncbi:hypothetical protein ACEE49_08695 [[Pasteurella] aerogenes]
MSPRPKPALLPMAMSWALAALASRPILTALTADKVPLPIAIALLPVIWAVLPSTTPLLAVPLVVEPSPQMTVSQSV